MTIEFYEGVDPHLEHTLKLVVSAGESDEGEVIVDVRRSRDVINPCAIAQQVAVCVPVNGRGDLTRCFNALSAFAGQLDREREGHVLMVAFPQIGWGRLRHLCEKGKGDLSRKIKEDKRTAWLRESKSPLTFGDHKARIRKLSGERK